MMRGKEEATITEMIGEQSMPLMVHLHYNWLRERHSRPPHPPRGLSGGPLALSLARRGGKLPSVVLFPAYTPPSIVESSHEFSPLLSAAPQKSDTCVCLIVYLKGAHLIGMHLTGIHLTGMHLTGVHLIGAHLISVHLMSVSYRGDLTGVQLVGWVL